MRRCRYCLLLFIAISQCALGQQGKDGSKTVTSSSFTPNEYTALTTDAITGSTVLKVNNSGLNTKNYFSSPLASGDLLMIIQMQGATIAGTPNDSTWGRITSYNSSGLYEFSEVLNVPDINTINIKCPLINSYSQTGKTQIIRIPRYTSLTINNGGKITADPWDGNKGGVIVLEVQNNTTIDSGGMIDATAKGFRGGMVNNLYPLLNLYTGFASTNNNAGAEKGESIAGYQTDYNPFGGKFGRGAPANGGGGGNAWNAPGGGGANAGNLNSYTGNGNPDTLTNSSWIRAWNLEYNGFASATSSGGGRGGYNVSGFNLDALTLGPNNASWESNFQRANNGGKGGRPLDYSGGRIFLGGGGGAGAADDQHGGPGGRGGGMVYLISYGDVTGNGSIKANGENGGESNSMTGSQNGDAAGGAGGGGTVIIYSSGPVQGISIYANGGNGGNQVKTQQNFEAEGPGGGGGGGYIAISNGSIYRETKGGKNGTTNSPALTEFPPDGATMGGAGMPDETISSLPVSGGNGIAGVISAHPANVCYGSSSKLIITGSNGSLQWQSSPDGINFQDITGATIDSITTSNLTDTTYFRVRLTGGCGGDDTSDVQVISVTPLSHAGTLSALKDSICSGDTTMILLQPGDGTIQWQFSDNGFVYTTLTQVLSDSLTLSNLDRTSYFRVISSGVCNTDTSNIEIINVIPEPPVAIASSGGLICSGDSVAVCATGGLSYLWNSGETSACIFAKNAGGYWVTATGALGCTAVSEHRNLQVHPIPSVAIVVQGDTLSSFGAVSYQWYLNGNKIDSATSPVYIARQPGNYSLEITDLNGCHAVSTPVLITGLNEISESLLSIYPNPVLGTNFEIKVSEMLIGSLLSVLEINGKVIHTSNIESQNVNLDMHLSIGAYFLQVRSENAFIVKRFMRLK